jgi:hypothetical protein
MMLATRILGYALAAFLAFMGIQKFIGDVPIFQIIEANAATQWGVDLPWIDPWFRYVTGALEIIAAALLVLRHRRSGGALATLILAGALAAHLTVLGIDTPMSSAEGAAKSPMLFFMALAALAASLLITVGAIASKRPARSA